MLHIDQHPIPKAEDLFVTLAGGKKFSEPNLSQADQQILLHLNDCKYTTINTHLGFLLGLLALCLLQQFSTCYGKDFTWNSKNHMIVSTNLQQK